MVKISIDDIILHLKKGDSMDEMWDVVDKIGRPLNDVDYCQFAESICGKISSVNSSVQMAFISLLYLVDETDPGRSTPYLNKLMYFDFESEVKSHLYWTLEAAGNDSSIESLLYAAENELDKVNATQAFNYARYFMNHCSLDFNQKESYLIRMVKLREVKPELRF